MTSPRRRKRARKHIAHREIAAAALSLLLPPVERDRMRAERWPAKKVISLFTPDHNVLHAFGGPDKWWNITMTLRGPELKAKDARDTSLVAKNDTLKEAQEEFRRRVLQKPCGQKRKKTGSIRSRGFEKRQSRGFQQRGE